MAASDCAVPLTELSGRGGEREAGDFPEHHVTCTRGYLTRKCYWAGDSQSDTVQDDDTGVLGHPRAGSPHPSPAGIHGDPV
ncbi:hypothetical protein FKM82_023169 [Ascaphus truei]